ncbi:MAG: terpene cyclase/mutase family protein [Gemmataceae bacterium]|nr:terpene cyclase/mutase family protein [Gemmataceae bacterium]
MTTLVRALAPAAAVAAVFALAPAAPSQQKTAVPPEKWKAVVDKAVAFVKSTQEPGGGWSTKQNPGVTGVVVTGVLQCGLSPDDPPAAKGLAYIEGLINPQAGHIAGADPRVGLQNYVTSVNVMALTAAKRDAKYRPVIGNAGTFLRKLQWDDGEGKTTKDDFYGGAGYDSKSRPDLSNTQFFLDALKDSGAPADDPAFKKALVFVSRCQNLESEHNTAPWAGRINDGSFIYSAAAGGSTKTSDDPAAPLTGYGSMTYAGIKSMIYCGVGPDDPRMKKAVEWIKKNYTLDANPGMPPQLAHRGLYYYYHTFAKTMDLLGQDLFEDAAGVKHDWRAELVEVLAKRQRPDGSWANDNDRWMEGDPNLVTGYCLMALSHCRPK